MKPSVHKKPILQKKKFKEADEELDIYNQPPAPQPVDMPQANSQAGAAPAGTPPVTPMPQNQMVANQAFIPPQPGMIPTGWTFPQNTPEANTMQTGDVNTPMDPNAPAPGAGEIDGEPITNEEAQVISEYRKWNKKRQREALKNKLAKKYMKESELEDEEESEDIPADKETVIVKTNQTLPEEDMNSFDDIDALSDELKQVTADLNALYVDMGGDIEDVLPDDEMPDNEEDIEEDEYDEGDEYAEDDEYEDSEDSEEDISEEDTYEEDSFEEEDIGADEASEDVDIEDELESHRIPAYPESKKRKVPQTKKAFKEKEDNDLEDDINLMDDFAEIDITKIRYPYGSDEDEIDTDDLEDEDVSAVAEDDFDAIEDEELDSDDVDEDDLDDTEIDEEDLKEFLKRRSMHKRVKEEADKKVLATGEYELANPDATMELEGDLDEILEKEKKLLKARYEAKKESVKKDKSPSEKFLESYRQKKSLNFKELLNKGLLG